MFYLRRSQLLQIFNSSPDETAFFRLIASRENVPDTLTMIQPTLTSYSFENPDGIPVFLDTASRGPDKLLVFDTFFHVVVWTGDQIAQWRKDSVQDNPDYAHFKELLENPVRDAKVRSVCAISGFVMHQISAKYPSRWRVNAAEKLQWVNLKSLSNGFPFKRSRKLDCMKKLDCIQKLCRSNASYCATVKHRIMSKQCVY